MFGFWFAITGLFFGTLCSYFAKKKNRNREEWFTIGVIFSVVGFFLIALLPKISENPHKDSFAGVSEEMKISFTQ